MRESDFEVNHFLQVKLLTMYFERNNANDSTHVPNIRLVKFKYGIKLENV